jgi:hypothetical protein
MSSLRLNNYKAYTVDGKPVENNEPSTGLIVKSKKGKFKINELALIEEGSSLKQELEQAHTTLLQNALQTLKAHGAEKGVAKNATELDEKTTAEIEQAILAKIFEDDNMIQIEGAEPSPAENKESEIQSQANQEDEEEIDEENNDSPSMYTVYYTDEFSMRWGTKMRLALESIAEDFGEDSFTIDLAEELNKIIFKTRDAYVHYHQKFTEA